MLHLCVPFIIATVSVVGVYCAAWGGYLYICMYNMFVHPTGGAIDPMVTNEMSFVTSHRCSPMSISYI